MIIGTRKYYVFLHSLVGVLFLMAGNFLIYEEDFFKGIIQFLCTAYVVIFLCKNINLIRLNVHTIIYLCIGSFVLLFSALNSELIQYALMKYDSIIFCSLVSSIYFYILIRKNGFMEVMESLLYIGLFLLIPTLIYKWQFGFYQRDVRFFLNGANVFGWLSGFYALLCLIIARNKVYYLYFIIFLMCVFWSQSKGALISLFISTILLLLYKNRFSIKALIYIIIITPAFLLFKYLINNYFADSRINAIFRILDGETGDADYGSVGIRLEMYNSAIELFKSEMLVGVGLGNFSYLTNYGIAYPHNVPLEVLAETGLIGGFFFLYFYLLFLLLNRNFYIFLFVEYFFIVCLSSGDLSYLRYSMFFLLLGLILKRFNSMVTAK